MKGLFYTFALLILIAIATKIASATGDLLGGPRNGRAVPSNFGTPFSAFGRSGTLKTFRVYQEKSPNGKVRSVEVIQHRNAPLPYNVVRSLPPIRSQESSNLPFDPRPPYPIHPSRIRFINVVSDSAYPLPYSSPVRLYEPFSYQEGPYPFDVYPREKPVQNNEDGTLGFKFGIGAEAKF